MEKVVDDDETMDDDAHMGDDYSHPWHHEEENFGFGKGSSAASREDNVEADMGLGEGDEEGGAEGGAKTGGVEGVAEPKPSLKPIRSWAFGPREP